LVLVVSLLASCNTATPSPEDSYIDEGPDFDAVGRTTVLFGTKYEDSAYDIALDAQGNAYLTGRWEYINYSNGGNASIIKVDPAGKKIWSVLLDGGSIYDDRGIGIALNGAGHVFVAGDTYGDLEGNQNLGVSITSSSADVFLSELDGDGQKIRTGQWGSIYHDYCSGMAVTPSGAVYVGGNAMDQIGDVSCIEDDDDPGWCSTDLFVSKWADGVREWTAVMGGSHDDDATALAADGAGNIYSLGFVSGFTYGDLTLFKTAPDGKPVTNQNLSYLLGYHDTIYGEDVLVDLAGEVYVVGAFSEDDRLLDAFLVKLDVDLEPAWIVAWGSEELDHAQAIARDGAGNLYVTGYTWGGNIDGNQGSGGEDIFLTSFTADGTKRWTKQWGPGRGIAVAVNEAGTIVYVAGDTTEQMDGNTPKGEEDIFLTIYDLEKSEQ